MNNRFLVFNLYIYLLDIIQKAIRKWFYLGFPFVLTDYNPCSDVEERSMQVSTTSPDQNVNSQSCYDKMIRLGYSRNEEPTFRINKNGLFVFHIQVDTYGEDNISSLMVNGVEVLQMFSPGKQYYSGSQLYPTWNEATIYTVLHLQTNDEVSFRNISGSFTSGYFIGWRIAE